MRAAHLKIALFVLFLLAPAASLLLFGAVEGYGRTQIEFPPLGKALLAKKRTLDQFGDAVLERTIVQRTAVQLRSWIGYRLVGFVDSQRVVSGNHGWLFYRPEFNGGKCIDETGITARLRSFAVLTDIGRAAGVDVILTMSSDKSTIYPEALNAVMRGYWRCRVENSAKLRRLFRQELPDLIDHAEALLAEKARHPEISLYYRTDTHWTPYGGAIALRQLLGRLYPDAHVPAPRRSATTTPKPTDLARMLLLPIEEQAPTADQLLARNMVLPAGVRTDIATLIIHDSFYGAIAQQIKDAFPDPMTMVSFDQSDRLLAHGLSADRLIINAIERKFLTAEANILAWRSGVAVAILNRNIQRAESCESFDPAVAAVRSEEAPRRRVIAVRAVASDHLPCLRVSLTTKKGVTLRIALPDPATGVFEPGRALEYRVSSSEPTVAFVLPGYVAGRAVEVSADAGIDAVAIGVVSAGPLATRGANSEQP